MTPRITDLIGQSLMLSFEGCRASPELKNALRRTRASGVILFAHNIGTPAELHALTGELQAHAAQIGLPPLLIAIDQEGGTVTRLRAPLVTTPSQMSQAATGDPQAAYQCARITGQQLRSLGINLNFAPVLDVNCNPANPVIGTRSFGEDPVLVSEFAMAALHGYRTSGVIATGKHFPGHGDTDSDSHLGLPTVGHAWARLSEIELAPFEAAIRVGIPALMSAHIVFSALDRQPATLSRSILTTMLRDQLGFAGVIFTDALDMQALAAHYTPNEAALRAKAAGADVLLPLGSLDAQIVIAGALAAAVERGELGHELFAATARRLDALRQSYTITYEVAPFAEPSAAAQEMALAIARRGLTITQGAENLPLGRHTRLALIDCVQPRFALVEEAFERAALLRSLMTQAFPDMSALAVGPELSDEQQAEARAVAAGSEIVVLVTRNAALLPRQAEFARMIAELGPPLVLAAARSPYDATLIPSAATVVLCYGDPEVSLHALVDVLTGRAQAQGKLPVTLPSLQARLL